MTCVTQILPSSSKADTVPNIHLTLVAGGVKGQGGGFNCPQKNGFYPDSIQCDLYYHCQDGEAEEKLCPDGLLFDDNNPSKERCDTRHNVDCGDRNELREYT